ncbi:MAG: LamG domain-containing protein [Polyangiaceae bacterium]|nr:LamG domain-containing protein [Polyangiaceae bacterium]
MSLNYVLRQFDAIGPMGPRASLTIDQNFIGSADIIALLRSIFSVYAITIDLVTSQTLRADDQLRLVGTTALFDAPDVNVTFIARELDGRLVVTFDMNAPPGWSLAKTCPYLPTHALRHTDGPDGDWLQDANVLTRLSFGAVRLICSNAAYFDDTLGRNIVPGLNLVGELHLQGPLYTLGFLLQEDKPLHVYGPIKEFSRAYDPLKFLGIRLHAPLMTDVANIGPLVIQSAELFMKSALSDYDRDPNISATQGDGLYLLAQSTLAGRPLELIGKLDIAGTSTELSLRGTFADFNVAGFSNLSQTVGVDGFDCMPEDMPKPNGLALTDFGVTFDCIDYSVSRLLVGVGLPMHWEIVPDTMSLTEIAVVFSVSRPFSSGRYISTTLTGLLAFKKFSLAAHMEFPSYRIGAGLPAGQTLPFGDVIESFLPNETDLPALTITQLLLQAAPKEQSFSIAATIKDLLSIPVGGTSFDVAGLVFLIDYVKVRGVRAIVSAQMRMADASAVLSGEVNNGTTLSGSLSNFELKKFWSLVTNGDSLPDEVPDIVFQTLSIRVNLETGAFSATGNATVAWDHLTSEGSLSTNVQFTFTHDKVGDKHAIAASISLQGTGPVHVVDGFSLQAFNFLFNYNSTSGWALSGSLGVDIFDTRMDLQAGYEDVAGIKKFKFRTTATPAKQLIGIDGIGSYSFQQFDLLIDRRLVGDKRQTFFDLRIASRLAIENAFAVDGYLSLMNTAEGKKALLFKPNAGTAGFKLDFPTGEGMAVKGDVFEIGFVKETETTAWTFTGTLNIGFMGFPGFLGDALPAKVTAKLVAGTKDVRISALNVTDPVGVAFPTIDGKSLGKAFVQLTEVGIAFKPSLGLVIEAGLGLPAELNTFLGAQIFRVYQPGNVATMARTRLTISGTGVAVQFLGSPFAAANTVVVGGDTWFDVDFGEYGAIRLKMPTFIYDGVSQYFEAGGGIQITRTLALPLAPLKMFLEACGGKTMADVFPDKIPLDGLVLVDQNDDLEIDKFVDFLEQAGDVPNDVVTILKTTGKVLNRFPDGFKHYFNLKVPESLEFKFGFSPTGRITIGLVAPKTPVRVLFPTVVQSYVPMPGLCGIEVRKFTVGTLMAGALMYGEVDAVIDQFDLPSLVVSLALPTDPSFPLPTSDQLQRRIILDDVFCVIPISAGLPIPIPLFYDEIGFEYMGVEGLGLQAHVGFPKPALDGARAAAIFQAFSDFMKKPKALLNPQTPPGGFELAFTFHDEYLQAPEYLGGKFLGTKGKTIKVGTWKNVASMMNFCKTFSINDCIAAIPLEQRVGSAEYKFAFMKFDADWMLTTPAEFKAGAFKQMKLTASDVDDFVAVLPAVATAAGGQVKRNEEGLVAFVRGQADIGFMRLEAALGLAASSSMGFNTGFKFEGAIGKVVLGLEGAVMVNSPIVTTAAPVVTTTETPALFTQTAPALKMGVVTVFKKAAVSAAQKIVSAAKRDDGKALSLNGKNAWIEIPASDSLMLPEYTIEMWIRPGKEQGDEWIELFGIDTLQNGCQRNYYLEINTKGAFYVHRFKDAKNGNSGAPHTPNGSVKWEEWQHVAITNDGVTAKTYINGNEVASGPVQGGLVLLKDTVYIGKLPGSGMDKLFKGEIAEVRIWKAARDADDIEENMREVLDGDEKNLVSLYRFDSNTGDRAVDICGRNHGTIKNGAFVNSDLLMLDGLEFDGQSSYIEIPDSKSLRIGPYTVEVWLKPYTPEESLEAVLAKRMKRAKPGALFKGQSKEQKASTRTPWAGVFGKTGRNYSVILHRKGFIHHRFHTSKGPNDGAPNTADGAIDWSNWNHIAITNDGKVARTYLNGAKVAEGPVAGNNLIVDDGTIVIGRTADAPAETFVGQIAEIRLWSGARSPEELATNAGKRLDGKTANLVSLWRLTDVDGDTLNDVCGRNPGRLHVKPKRASTATRALAHDGLVFNGTNDYALIERSDKFKTEKYTIETWIQPDKEPKASWQCILGAGGAGPKLYLSKDGLVSHRYTANVTEVVMPKIKSVIPTTMVPKSTTSVKAQVLNTDNGQVRFGEWNHIAVTSDGSAITIVVNGVARKKAQLTGPLVVDAAAMSIGRSEDGTDKAFFRGSIDDIRYWSVARSPEQIAANMAVPLSGKETDLVAYYDMDHTSGIELTDVGPNKIHGKVFGADWALAAPPAARATQTAAIQIQGHAHLDVLGHRAMSADLRLVDSTIWFNGELDLFPKNWPIRVYGNVEGMVSKKRFYLSGETKNELFGLTLSQSRLFLSNEEMRLEGRWLGQFLLLNISWDKDNPIFSGTVGFRVSPKIDFGTIRIGGVKVADNVRLSFDIGADVSVTISKSGFAAKVRATFTINGKGFDLSFGISIAPQSFEDLVNWIKQKIIDDAVKYLAHLFTDAATWLANIGNNTIEFAKHVGQAVGGTLKSVFKVSKEQAASLMKSAGYGAHQVGAALEGSYKLAAGEAAGLLKGTGYAAEEVGHALQSAFSQGAEDTAKVMKSIGYGVEDVGKALGSAFGKGVDECGDLLKRAGFNSKDVNSALKTVANFGKSVGSGIDKGLKSLKCW